MLYVDDIPDQFKINIYILMSFWIMQPYMIYMPAKDFYVHVKWHENVLMKSG